MLYAISQQGTLLQVLLQEFLHCKNVPQFKFQPLEKTKRTLVKTILMMAMGGDSCCRTTLKKQSSHPMAIRIYMRYDFDNQIVKGQKHLYERGKRMTKKRNVDEGDNFDQVKTKGRQ